MAAGGKREGCGRKRYNPEEKRVQLIITIAPETKVALKRMSQERNTTIGRMIDKMIEQ